MLQWPKDTQDLRYNAKWTIFFFILFSLPCPKQPISNRPNLKRLNRKTNIAHRGIENVRIVIKDDPSTVEKMAARLTALRDRAVVVKISDFAFRFVICLPLQILRHVNARRVYVPRLDRVFPVPSCHFLHVSIR